MQHLVTIDLYRHIKEYLQDTCMKAFKDINNCLFIRSNSNFLALILPVFLRNRNNVYNIPIYRQMSFPFCWQFCVVVIFNVARCDRTISSFCIHINTIQHMYNKYYRYVYTRFSIMFTSYFMFTSYAALYITYRTWQDQITFNIL